MTVRRRARGPPRRAARKGEVTGETDPDKTFHAARVVTDLWSRRDGLAAQLFEYGSVHTPTHLLTTDPGDLRHPMSEAYERMKRLRRDLTTAEDGEHAAGGAPRTPEPREQPRACAACARSCSARRPRRARSIT